MIARIRLKAFINAVSLLMFFVTFFTNYFMYGAMLMEAFIRGVVSFFVAFVIIHLLLFVWKFAFSPGEWKLIVDGEPEIIKEEISEEEEEAVEGA